MSVRTEALKCYVLAVATECGLSRTQIIGALATDLPIVLKEIGATMATNLTVDGLRIGGDFVKSKVDEVVADIGKRGLKNVLTGMWKKLDEAYDAGLKENARKR